MSKVETLSESLKRRDQDTFTRFVREHEQSLLRIAARITGSPDDAEELRQKVFLAVWQKPHQLPSDEHLAAWIRRCIINASIDLLRKRELEPKSTALDPSLTEAGHSEDLEAKQLLQEAMSTLTAGQRALLSLKFDEKLSVREMASALGKPHTTVQSQLEKAIQKLRNALTSTT
ncbi:MAG: sigma-70 family RNA polymerase sigma factor [Pirellulaceae bacterium]